MAMFRLAAVRGIPILLVVTLGMGGAITTYSATPQFGRARPAYDITVNVDVEGKRYWGRETVTYVNDGGRPLREIWFLLYPNIVTVWGAGRPPRLFIQRVEIAGTTVPFKVHRFTSVRIPLPEPLDPGERLQVDIAFFGRLTELDPSATTLVTHFTEQINQIIGPRRRHYWNPPTVLSGGTLVLSDFYPVLARRDGRRWRTQVPRAVEDISVPEVADYRVRVRLPKDFSVFASGVLQNRTEADADHTLQFQGRALRDFLIVAGRHYRIASRRVGPIEVQSIFRPEDERLGRQVLQYAVTALTIYQAWFGPYPYPQLRLIETPLPGGRMSVDGACLIALARAYYVDVHRSGKSLPRFISESAALIEDALEFNVAYEVARQWWGTLVGFDPERAHFLDDALATYAALMYYERAYGPEVAQREMDTQLKAAYRVYRMFGGEDQPVVQPVERFANGFQYAAIVHAKGALFFDAVRRLMGDEKFALALRAAFRAGQYRCLRPAELMNELCRVAGEQRPHIQALYHRWMTWRYGDRDIGEPEYQILVSVSVQPGQTTVPSAFERLGRFIARQMTRVGKYAVKPF